MQALQEAIRQDMDRFVRIRRDIHQHPELAFEEHRTAELVAANLAQWGYEVTRGLGGTGVVGQLRRGSGAKRLGLRADMDALPIREATGLPYASRNAGVMHACGHDGHTAMLLAAAKFLASHGKFDGTLNLIFQPAEEGGGGAKKMIEDGLFERFPCDAVFALHNMPGLPVGHMQFRTGEYLASSDYATITITGLGGHGARPNRTIDPIVVGASIVMALQTIVSRNVDPLQAAVITVGSFIAGTANNVIPGTAILEASVRCTQSDVRALLEKRVREVVEAQAQSFGAQASVEWKRGYPVLVNSADETRFAREVAYQVSGKAHVIDQGPMMLGSEDFAYMLEQVPGSYVMLGNGAGDSAGACSVHNPNYDFNDGIIGIGAEYWVRLAQQYLVA